MNKETAAEALLSHFSEEIERIMLHAWATFAFSEEIPVEMKLIGMFRGKWGSETGPARRVKDYVRIVSHDNGIPRKELAEEVVKLIPGPLVLPGKRKKEEKQN